MGTYYTPSPLIDAGGPSLTRDGTCLHGALGPVGAMYLRRDSWSEMGRAKASTGVESSEFISLTSKLKHSGRVSRRG